MATRQVLFGYESKLFVSNNAGTQSTFDDDQEIRSIIDLTLNYEMAMVDVSDRASEGAASEVPTQNKITISGTMNARADKWGYSFLRSCYRNQQPLAFLATDKNDNVRTLGDAYVSKMTINETLAEAVKVDIELAVTTELRPPVVTEPAYTTGDVEATSGTWGTGA